MKMFFNLASAAQLAAASLTKPCQCDKSFFPLWKPQLLMAVVKMAVGGKQPY
jgi:hypothetical protein